MENIENQSIEKVTSSEHGGARPGAGRPKGTTNRLTAKEILETCENIIGKPFAVSLVEGYALAIQSGDMRNRVTYEKIILDKTATTIVEAEVTNTADAVEMKKAAFDAALAALLNQKQD